MWLFVFGCVLPAFWISFLATGLMRLVAPRIGLIDRPAARKVHKTPTPLGGGVGIWLGVVGTLVAAQTVVWFLSGNVVDWIPAELQQHLDGASFRGPQMWAILGAGTILAAMGLVDDRRPLPWQPRIAIQLLVSSLVVWSGVRATLFIEEPILGACASVLWFVILVNSFNFLDNMDGLSGGIGLIVCLIFATMMLTRTGDPRWLVGGFFLVLAGSILGFLCHNWSPARIFMGDSGSYFIGFSIASMTILGTFYSPSDRSDHVMLAPLCVLAVPLYDILSVILIRLREGRSPFQPDKKHFSHRLVAMGLRPVQAVLTVHLVTLATGLAGLLLYALPGWPSAMLVVSIVVALLAIVAILESTKRPTDEAGATNPPANSAPCEL